MNRNLLLDNAKLITIFFVVMGHMIEPFIDQSVVFETIFKIIYSFHMPVFIFIAGLLTRQNTIENYELKLLKSILIPFIAFTLLFEIPEIIINGTLSHYTKSLSPYWILWFLFSLFSWKIISPFFMKLRYPILISIVISLMSGYFESIGYFLGLSRTLYFFPIFLIGFKLTPKYLSSSRLLKIPKVIPIGIILLNITLFCMMQDVSYYWLFGSFSYSKLGVSYWYAPVIRFGFLTLSFITSGAVLLLIPNKRTFYTNRGRKSLYIYLWHGFFYKGLVATGLFSILNNRLSDVIILFILIILTCVVTYICSMEFVDRLTNRILFNPISKFLLGDVKSKKIS